MYNISRKAAESYLNCFEIFTHTSAGLETMKRFAGWVERSTARRLATANRRGLESIFSPTHQNFSEQCKGFCSHIATALNFFAPMHCTGALQAETVNTLGPLRNRHNLRFLLHQYSDEPVVKADQSVIRLCNSHPDMIPHTTFHEAPPLPAPKH